MPVSRALRRLLQVRVLQEEQHRMALETALGALHQLQDALGRVELREQRGRELVMESIQTGEMPDRLAGLAESRHALLLSGVISDRIEEAQTDVTELREVYLSTRIERRQAETLIEEAEARDAVEASRRSQQALDDWHRGRAARKPRTST